MSGIRTAASTGGNGNEGGTGKEGRQILTQISNNDWIRVKGVDFGSGATKFKGRAAAASGSSGSIELRTGSNTGTLIGACNITSTGGWTVWNTFECDVDVSGVKDFLYLVFKGSASELFRLDWYMFEGAQTVVTPDENGYFFHHTYEDGTAQGWAGRGGATVANTNTQKANGSRSLAVSGRTASWHGAYYGLNASAFVPGSEYSFSAIAMYAEGTDVGVFKLTLQYTLNDTTRYGQIDQVEAGRGNWVMLENKNFAIPAGASNLILYVEMPNDSLADFYVDDAMGGIAGAAAPGRGGTTPVDLKNTVRRGHAAPLVTIKGRTLNVNSSTDSKVSIRLVNMMGKTVANFSASGDARLSLKQIPAGAYIVEAKRIKDGYRMTSAVILK
jgi:hypothetical protein